MKLCAKAILWCMSLVVFESALYAQCINAPRNGTAVEPGYVFRYAFIGMPSWTPDRLNAVFGAMNEWAQAGLATFSPVSEGQEATLTFAIGVLDNPAGVGLNDFQSVDGWTRRMAIMFTSDTSKLESIYGYFKACIHELGHGFGFSNAGGSGGSTVMNVFAGKDDSGGNLPEHVTSCDQIGAGSNTYDWDRDGYWKIQLGGNDCDDNDPTNHPFADSDGDGYFDARCGGNDCMDSYAAAYPGSSAWMACSYADLNCNGSIDLYDCAGYGSPILISTNGGRITLTSKSEGVLFDLLGTGEKIQIPWTVANSDDAWLVLDRNNDGVINDGTELFGTATPQPEPQGDEPLNGFAALAVFDEAENGGNGDNIIDSEDAIFSRLQLWRDVNHDGISEPNELYTLPDYGITTIDLDYRAAFRVDEYGNIMRYRSKVYDSRGSSVARWAWDVFLKLE